MKIKMIYILFILVIVGIAIGAFFYLKPKYERSETYISPNKEYVLELYTQTNFKHIGFTNQTDFKKAYVVLKNSNGDILAKPNAFNSCTFSKGDFKVFWELENDKVYFTKFNFIDVKNQAFNCM